MRRKNVLQVLVVLCCLAVLLEWNALSREEIQQEETRAEAVDNEVIIPVVFRADPTTNIRDNEKFVEEFNQAYAGIYRIEVDWLVENAGGYRNKLKQWNVLDEMPVLITDAGFDNDFYRLLVTDGRLVDLRPYMEASGFWMEAMRADILKDCTEEDGSIYLSPLGSSMETYAGIIYNEELLREAGYETFPQTWEEFFVCLQDLKNQGITPLALHGSGTFWVPMLLATAYMQRTEEGSAFLGEDFPKSYQNESMADMFLMLRTLYDYSFADAVELDFDQAGSRFTNGEAAIIANGLWMFSSMEDHEEMRFTTFPENTLMNSPRMGAWAVTAGHSKEVTEGAVKVLEFRIQSEQETVKRMLKEESESLLEETYIKAVKDVKNIMPNYQMKWEQELQNEFFTEYIPVFLRGEISVEELLEMMDKKVEEIERIK